MNRAIKLMPLLTILLAGCGTADATQTAPADAEAPAPDWWALDFKQFEALDLQDSVRSVASTLQEVNDIGPKRRTQAALSLKSLSVNCAYNRGTLQVPIAIHQVVMSIDPQHINPTARQDWQLIRRGLTAHVAVLDLLDVDLPVPGPDDNLFRISHTSAIVDRSTLAKSADPLLATAPLLAVIADLTEQLDDSTIDVLEFDRNRLSQALGHDWRLLWHLQLWNRALVDIEPSVDHPEAKAKINAMVSTLDAFALLGC